jgi:hypothetical protein
VFVIEIESARKVCEVSLAALPVFALSYLAADRERFQLSKGWVDTDASEAQNRLWRAATVRLDATFGIVFALMTVAGMAVSLAGLVVRPRLWMLVVITTALGLGLMFILLGVVVNLSKEIDENILEDDTSQDIYVRPSKTAANLESLLGTASMLLIGLGLPIAIIAVDIILLTFGAVK